MTADRFHDPITHDHLENLNGYKITLHRSNPQLVVTASVILLRKIQTSFAESGNSSWECGFCIYILSLISWAFPIGFIIITTITNATIYLDANFNSVLFHIFIFLYLYHA